MKNFNQRFTRKALNLINNLFINLKITKMNLLKNTLASLTILGLIIISGCSDSLITQGDMNSQNSLSSSELSIHADEKLSQFDLSVKLAPGDSYTLKSEDVNLKTFRLISLKNCNMDEFRITSSTIDSDVGCYWEGYNGFGLEDITIENIGKSNVYCFGNIYGVTRKK